MFQRKKTILIGLLLVLAVAGVCLWAQIDIARTSTQFDLRILGRSIYEAQARKGKWPAQNDDLQGTEYLSMPYRKAFLDQGQFVVVWQQDLDPNPEKNRDRVLAYDNSTLLSRFGRVWVCRGDLRVEHMKADQLNDLVRAVAK